MPARQAGKKLEFKARSRTSRQIQQDTDRQEAAVRQDIMGALKAYWHAKHKN
jgi:hypothetical protein